jgi:hypothetical protein
MSVAACGGIKGRSVSGPISEAVNSTSMCVDDDGLNVCGGVEA